MANRATYSEGLRVSWPKMVDVHARVSFGASGAPTLDTKNSRGVVGVTRNSAGDFTFVFGSKINGRNSLDPYVQLIDADVVFDTSGAGSKLKSAAPNMQIVADSTKSGTAASVEVVLSNVATSPAATDPASGEVGYFRFRFIDTKAG